MISINSLTVAYGGFILLNDINFHISENDKIGLVGKNGAGKSTILKLICGIQNPTNGKVAVPNDVKIGYLPQIMEHHRGRTVIDEAMTAFADMFALEDELEKISLELAERQDYESKEYHDLIVRMNEVNDRLAYTRSDNPRVQAERTLMGLGFKYEELSRNTETFSQGWNMRIELAKILLSASNLTAQGMAADAIVEVEQLLDQYQTELAVAKKQKDAGQKEYDAKKAEYDAADAQLTSAKKQLDEAEVQLAEAERQLEDFKRQIEASGDKLQFGSIEAQTKYMAAQAELALRSTQYQNIQAIIEKAEKTFNASSEEVNAKIGSVKTEYEKGQNLLQNIEDSVGWSVYTRHDSPGYTGYGQAADNMVRLAYIFPTFFFIVSTLVCLTTMTRMVEEERTQLGTLKALGYSNKMISGKYLLYSAVASFVGVILGTVVGSIGVPLAICGAWGIMYEMPETILQFLPLYIIFCKIAICFFEITKKLLHRCATAF